MPIYIWAYKPLFRTVIVNLGPMVPEMISKFVLKSTFTFTQPNPTCSLLVGGGRPPLPVNVCTVAQYLVLSHSHFELLKHHQCNATIFLMECTTTHVLVNMTHVCQ